MKVKMMLIETMSVLGIMALGGYMIAMKYPDKVKKAKESVKDACRILYTKLDED